MYKYKFTVFTPTYNRAHTLHRVYESLKKQTFRDFEWVIVDDGSSDNTETLVRGWIDEAGFVIRYFYQQNKGKHTAINRGVKEANGELFLTLDSDDEYLPRGLEILSYYWDSIPNEERHKYSAVTGLCIDQKGQIIGEKFPKDITDSNAFEVFFKYKVGGEKSGFQKTDILKEFPFPEYEGERFVPEGLIWNRIGSKYLTRYINEPVRLYYENGADSLSIAATMIKAKSPKGSTLYYQEMIKLPIPFMDKVKYGINYVRYSLLSGYSIIVIFKNSCNFFITLGVLPLAFYLFRKDVKRLIASNQSNNKK